MIVSIKRESGQLKVESDQPLGKLSFIENIKTHINFMLDKINFCSPVFNLCFYTKSENCAGMHLNMRNGLYCLFVDHTYLVKDNFPKELCIGWVHELAHFYHKPTIEPHFAEGFAELITLYTLSRQIPDDVHCQLLGSLSTQYLKPARFWQNNKMYHIINVDNFSVRYFNSYVSMYLWMAGYSRKLEQLKNINQMQALELMLKHFIDSTPDKISNLVEMPSTKVFDTIELHLFALKEVYGLTPQCSSSTVDNLVYLPDIYKFFAK